MKRWLIVAFFLLAPCLHAQTQIQSFAADPASCDSTRGLIYYNTVTQQFRSCGPPANTWNIFGGSGGGSVTSLSCGNLANNFTCAVTNPTTTPAISFTPTVTGPVLDCSAQSGADMGAKINACLAALPSSGGIADSTKFSSPQTISTAVVVNKPAVVRLCGIAITQDANISLTVANAALEGCADQSTVLTKGANIDQVTISGAGDSVSWLTLAGVSGSFTGSGVVISANYDIVQNNTISGEASDGIKMTVGTAYMIVINNVLDNFVTHAIEGVSGGGFGGMIQNNSILDGSATVGSNVELNTGALNFTRNNVSNAHGFNALHNINSNTNNSYYLMNFFQTATIAATAVSVGSFDYIDHNLIYGATGTSPVVVGGLGVTNNLIAPQGTGDAVDVAANGVTVANNFITQAWGSGTCSINLNSANGELNDVIANNFISTTGGTGNNAGICLTTVTAKLMEENQILNNTIVSNTGGGAGSAGVFFNNTAGITSPNGALNFFKNNICRGPSVCVLRTDAQNNKNYYENNTGSPSSGTFYSGGSTNDVVTDSLTGLTFSTLPTAGNGSQVYCTDCTQATPPAGGGTGAQIFFVNGQWSAQIAAAVSSCATANAEAVYTASTTLGCGNGDFTYSTHTLTAAAAGLVDLSAETTATGFKFPVIAGAAPAANGAIAYDSTSNTVRTSISAAASIIPTLPGTTNPTATRVLFWGANSTISQSAGAASATMTFSTGNIVGTNDAVFGIQANSASAWSMVDAQGSSNAGLALSTNTTTPVGIAPNHSFTHKFPVGGGLQVIGTAPSCTFTSGGGTTPSCALNTGSTDDAGTIAATTGTGSPGGTGTITLTFHAAYGTNAPVCVFMANNASGAGTWNGLAVMVNGPTAATTSADVFTWTNGTTPTTLTASTAYWINYFCFAK